MTKCWIYGLLVVFAALMFWAGYMTGAFVSQDPTPEQCLSVCVEEFEAWGC